ncbi:flavin-containing monooxygenase FMO GS-OX-like 5 isoform X2 [Tasmannia lanceolata]|uniref:flavin-containing monooxygenase FMO GS-OX-like 5 isoform X2 n=1 Tax=Tasmannia lanceolata TaxID=3420 RepID=UPI0040629CFD
MGAPSRQSLAVAVIGAGPAGIVAGRELRREGHKVVVFETGDQIGGTWIYNPDVESDPLGLDPSRKKVHSSLYESLRTNLPRESMGFRDYPFVIREGRDNRRFPGHREVFHYLNDFARDFELRDLVRFKTEVFEVERMKNGRWMVRSRKVGMDGDDDPVIMNEVYDGVVVCKGHYTEPRIAEISGIDTWPGKQIHSHNYRVPEPFRDQVVVLIGSSASSVDISRDISKAAKEVHISSRSAPNGPTTRQPGYDNMWLHSAIESAHEDGTVVFHDGSSVVVDIILHCTGYQYHFPFLKIDDIVTVDDNRVGPLYKHIFPPLLGPGLSFIGIPWKAIPFPMFELQSKWVACVLSGRVALPSQEEMMEDVKSFYRKLEADGCPKRYTHDIWDNKFDYSDWLAAECGYPPVEEWRKQMILATWKNYASRPENYRNEWEDHHLVLQAHKDFQQC